METEKLKEMAKKLANERPEIKKALDDLQVQKERIMKLNTKEYDKEVIIDGMRARIALYKRGVFEVVFINMENAEKAIEKLLK